jgi:hypothetical protein
LCFFFLGVHRVLNFQVLEATYNLNTAIRLGLSYGVGTKYVIFLEVLLDAPGGGQLWDLKEFPLP